jgi:hypothetical protein
MLFKCELAVKVEAQVAPKRLGFERGQSHIRGISIGLECDQILFVLLSSGRVQSCCDQGQDAAALVNKSKIELYLLLRRVQFSSMLGD